jgi:hypothetical protein
MSYVIHLWEEAAPASLQDADQLHDRLSDMPAPPNPKFAQLAHSLSQRFPAEVGGRGDAEANWVELPLDGYHRTRVYSLGLSGEGITRLLPALVTQATALGLTVYDEQAGRAYLPGGVVLDDAGLHAVREAGVDAAPGVALAQAKARYRAVVEPALLPHGFRFKAEKSQWHLVRTCPLGQQRITLAVRHDGSGVEFKPTGTVTPVLPAGLAPTIGPSVSVWFDTHDCEPIARRHWLNRDTPLGRHDLRIFMVTQVADLDDFLQSYRDLVLRTVLPFLDSTQTASAFVGADLQPEPWHASYKPGYATLAVAHWLGFAEFDRLVEAHAARHGADPGTQRILSMVVGRLKALPAYFGIHPRTDPS